MSHKARSHRRTRPCMATWDPLEPRRLMSAISFGEPAYYPAGSPPPPGGTGLFRRAVAPLLSTSRYSAPAAPAAGTRTHPFVLAGFTTECSPTPSVSGATAALGALADGRAYAELILDLHHVHPVSFLAAAAAKRGKLLLITDAIRAAGAGDGTSELGGQQVMVTGGAARLPDGTLAGSVLTLDVALRNAVHAGVAPWQAAAMVSSVPAAYLGLGDRGSLAVGARADLVVLDGDMRVEDVYVGGRLVG